MDEALAYLLDLRVRFRNAPEARAIVDRCLVLLAQAEGADEAAFLRLNAQVEALRAELEARLGPPRAVRVH